MLKDLFWEIVVERLFLNMGRTFLYLVTLGRFPSPEQAERHEGIFKFAGFCVWIVIVMGVSLFFIQAAQH